jgi:hypothetical protein
MNKYILFSILGITLLATPMGAVASSAPMTKSDWAQQMNLMPTPGIGCWMASYPSLAWTSVACSTSEAGPFTIGGSHGDDPAKSINYATTGAEGIFTSESGFTSETDSTQGTNWYSLQLNSNTYTTVVSGKSTTGWEQFIFYNEGTGGNTGTVFIQFWLIGYGACPAGWTAYGTSCYRNSPAATPGYEGPGTLNYYTVTGSVTSTTDTAKFCNSNAGLCYSTTDSDRVNLYSGNWWDSEYNVFGSPSSQANFNAGTSLGLKVDNFEPGESCPVTPISYTAETNNLSLGTCTGSSTLQCITFSES